MLKWQQMVLTPVLALALISSPLVIAISAQSREQPRRISSAPKPSSRARQSLSLARLPNRKPRNILFILTDDQRYDAMGFLRGQSFLETPNLYELARRGVYLPNAVWFM